MLCVRKMLFWWPLNSTIPSDDAEWLPFILRPPLKNPNALGYVIRSMMQWYIFCKMLEDGKAVKPWMSVVTFYHTIFTLCTDNIFHLKRTKGFVQESTQRSQYSINSWKKVGRGRGRAAVQQYKSFVKQISLMMRVRRINLKPGCPTHQVPQFKGESVILTKPTCPDQVSPLPTGTLVLSQLSVCERGCLLYFIFVSQIHGVIEEANFLSSIIPIFWAYLIPWIKLLPRIFLGKNTVCIWEKMLY